MTTRQFLYMQGAAAVAVGFLNMLGIDLFPYWNLWWYLLHFLGGVWVAFGVLWLCGLFKIRISWFYVLLFVLAIGIIWELWELLIDSVPHEGYVLDTTLDLIMDTCGGIAVVWGVYAWGWGR